MARGDGSEAAAAERRRKPRIRLLRPLRRLWRTLFGPRHSSIWPRPRTRADREISWLWPYLILSTNRGFPPRYENRDALILQPGRVASISIYHAMRARGYNAFHTHGISRSRQMGTMNRIGNDKRRRGIDALRDHTAALAHYELLVWYRQYKRRNGSPLKIITVTRDPVTWLSSHLILLRHKTLPQVRRWYQLHAGLPTDAVVDGETAIRAFGAELGAMILKARPSRGLEPALVELRRLATERWPGDGNFLDMARSGLSCAQWYDREIKDVIGIDVLADPALRTQGYARLETDYAEIMVARFEDMKRLAPAFGEFLGVPDFALPHDNATARTDDRAALRAAFEAGLESAGGGAVRRELRGTEYGRACGYDRLTD
jgi:hypothetical protein